MLVKRNQELISISTALFLFVTRMVNNGFCRFTETVGKC